MKSKKPTAPPNYNGEVDNSNALDISELSDFDLAGIVCRKFFIQKIDGVFHGFNGQYFEPLDNKKLNQLVLNALWNEQKQIRSTRKVRAIVDALHMLNFADNQESTEWLGFRNGVLDIQRWEFYSFPLPPGFPPPCITYHLCVDYDTRLDQLNDYVRSVEGYPPLADTYLDWIDWCSNYPDLRTPYADAFFGKIANNDPDLISRIYEMIGYILVPDTSAKCFFLLQGVPHSGKSILGRFIEGFFPKECVTSLDISRLGSQYLPKSFARSRLNLSMDLSDNMLPKKAVAMLKMMTGDDLITLESKYREAKPYRGQCKFLFSLNGTLKMKGRDTAFLDRIVCIPFKNSIPQEKWDRQLGSKLEEERNAIAMRALFHYCAFIEQDWIFHGSKKFFPDIEMQLSANETIEEFVKEKCDFTDALASYTEDLYRAYLSFCVENRLKPVGTKSGFAQRLAGLFPTKISTARWRDNDKNIRGFNGIILKKTEAPTKEIYYG